jgi:peptidoglycan/xylan/chitin deacetylase (PgdA/CDA1 family)
MTTPYRWLGLAATTMVGQRHPFVLCYHGVGTPEAQDPSGLFIGSEPFAHHLDVIAGSGYRVVGVGELWQLMHAGPGVDRHGAITFDDALVRTAREGIPGLLERGMRCSMFVATGLMGQPHPDLEAEMIMTAGEVGELAAAGVEIGAHSVDHPYLDRMRYEEVLDQMRRSRAVLEDLIGRSVTSMAYPYGRASAQTIRAAAEAGYELACLCSGPGPWRALTIPREPIHPTVNDLRLRAKMAGLYGPVHTLKNVRAARRFEPESPAPAPEPGSDQARPQERS